MCCFSFHTLVSFFASFAIQGMIYMCAIRSSKSEVCDENYLREAINKKKVTFLWTLSVPPLAPPLPPGLRTLRGVFFLKARTSDSRRLEIKKA